MKYVKYKGRVYAEVDSSADELYEVIKQAKDKLFSITKFIALSKSSKRFWESSGDEDQIGADRKFLTEAEEYASRLSKFISKAQNHLKSKK